MLLNMFQDVSVAPVAKDDSFTLVQEGLAHFLKNKALVTVVQNASFRTVDPLLLYIHFTDLAYHDPRRHHEGHHHR